MTLRLMKTSDNRNIRLKPLSALSSSGLNYLEPRLKPFDLVFPMLYLQLDRSFVTAIVSSFRSLQSEKEIEIEIERKKKRKEKNEENKTWNLSIKWPSRTIKFLFCCYQRNPIRYCKNLFFDQVNSINFDDESIHRIFIVI